jgi:hypothetical protein
LLILSLQQNYRYGKNSFCRVVRGWGREGAAGCGGVRGEMYQIVYAHMNKKLKINK